jgi:hypothetical protein
MMKENAEVNQDVDRTYIVYDYGGWVADHAALKDARKELADLGSGRQAGIVARTVTRIEIKTEQVIQTKR